LLISGSFCVKNFGEIKIFMAVTPFYRKNLLYLSSRTMSHILQFEGDSVCLTIISGRVSGYFKNIGIAREIGG